MIGITMATYWRKNGLTLFFLRRSINSIINQTHKNWKLFLVGDVYPFPEELKEFESERIYFENLTECNDDKRWGIAGHSPLVKSLELVQKECSIVAHLDDDDFWEQSHLSELNEIYSKYPETAFVYTQSTHKNSILPSNDTKENHTPCPYGLIHSAASWNVKKIPFSYPKLIDSSFVAGDALMWDTINKYCQKNNLKTVYVPKLTCHHNHEGYQTPFIPIL